MAVSPTATCAVRRPQLDQLGHEQVFIAREARRARGHLENDLRHTASKFAGTAPLQPPSPDLRAHPGSHSVRGEAGWSRQHNTN